MKVYLAFVGGGHGFNTAGKRTPPIKSLGGRQIKEHEFNEPVSQYLIEDLKRAGVQVYDAAPGDRDVPLRERTDYANRIYKQYCDKYGKVNVVAIYVSIHFNALDGKFDGPGKDPEGFSVHIDPGSVGGRKLAQCILDELKAGTVQKNRGIVEQNLHITRESHMPAVLTENGFMDNEREALLMLSPTFQKEVATEHAKGICKYFGIPYTVKKEVIRMFNPSSKAVKEGMVGMLEDAYKKKILTSPEWAEKAKKDQLPLDDAVGLLATVVHRTNVKK